MLCWYVAEVIYIAYGKSRILQNSEWKYIIVEHIKFGSMTKINESKPIKR